MLTFGLSMGCLAFGALVTSAIWLAKWRAWTEEHGYRGTLVDYNAVQQVIRAAERETRIRLRVQAQLRELRRLTGDMLDKARDYDRLQDHVNRAHRVMRSQHTRLTTGCHSRRSAMPEYGRHRAA